MKTPPRIIEFNGLGRPDDPRVTTGSVCLLLQEGVLTVMRVELLPEDQYGPCLHPATNAAELQPLVRAYWAEVDSTSLSPDRHWVIACPEPIAQAARF